MNDQNLLEDQPIAWTPTPDVIERAQLTKFMRQVGVSTWDELYEFSIRDVEKFTEEVLKFLDIKFDPPYEKLLDTSNGVEFPTWFGRNADAPVRNECRWNADALVRNEAESRTTAATFANKKGWHDRGYLRHFDGVVTQFVTFRLADSLPQNVLRRLEAEIERDNPSDPSGEFRKRVEEHLDQGIGECILSQPVVAEIVRETILNEHEKTCRLIAWVIMPNHVHLLLRPLEGFSLSEIMKSIKSVSSHKINKTLGRKGPVWQPDYFDRYIRDADHFGKTLKYIERNPVKAGLCSSPEEWTFSSAGTRTPSSATSADGTRTPSSAMSADGTRTPSSAMSADGTRTPSSAMSAKYEQTLSPEEPAIADEGVRVPTAGLNITTMCLDRWQTDGMKDQYAVIWEAEDADAWGLTYEELFENVELCSAGLRATGFGKGDAIGIHLPMSIETVVALLAINRIGAIAVPVFSGYGVDAISSRLNAVGARAIFTCDGFSRRGKIFNALKVAEEAVAKSPSVTHVFIVRYLDSAISYQRSAISYCEFKALQTLGESSNNSTEPTSAEDPLIILYTSGTTGKPKGIAHTHASFPIKAAQDMAFGTDVGKGTRISWYTDIGWMMGPWLIYGALINGATICIYDGAPDYPTPDRMWKFCSKHKVEVLGISPTLVRSLASAEGSADTPVRMDAASASTESTATERRGWYRHKLPHYDGTVTQFITFRLSDSLPQSVVEQMKYRLEHDKYTDHSDEFREMVDEYLDAGAGECILSDPNVAEIVEATILHEHGKSCDVKAWVVMPNHVHILLRPLEGYTLAEIMKRIKGVSSRKINLQMGRDGSVWQADYFDRYIRDEDDFRRKIAYIEENPVKAKLVSDATSWRFSSASRSADGPVRTDALSAPREFAVDQAAEKRGLADKSVRAPLRAPFERHDLSSLRIFASTGEPWNPAPWWWLFEKVGNSKLPIINYSGGTEIAGGILMGNPLLPIKPCSFPAPCLGMDVDILDEDGNPVEAGKVGELVIKQPWIGMARGFWQEKDRYLDTYWRRFKNIWVHGDWAMRDKDGHWFILGRSDDTLKVAGKRVGPAEVESLLVAHPLVTEAAVIGVPDEVKGTAMVAFAVLNDEYRIPNIETDDTEHSSFDIRYSELASELRELVARDMGKPLAPSKIHFVPALPKTRNAKVMRRVIRAAYLGEDPGDLSALEDPKAVAAIAASAKE